MLVVSEDLDDATKVLALPEVLGGVRLHKALGMHPEKATLGTKIPHMPLYNSINHIISDALARVGAARLTQCLLLFLVVQRRCRRCCP